MDSRGQFGAADALKRNRTLANGILRAGATGKMRRWRKTRYKLLTKAQIHESLRTFFRLEESNGR